jgi:hypothetical protein
MTYLKHMVECKCFLPQFKNFDPIPWHKFVVFSEVESPSGSVKPSYVQCPHCAAVHRVTEVETSQILNKDGMLAIQTIDDIKPSLPVWLSLLLERHECELPTWQEAQYVLDHKLWGTVVILAKLREGDMIMGKYVMILSEQAHRVDNFERFDGLV